MGVFGNGTPYFPGVAGMARSFTPSGESALTTAFIIAAGAPIVPASPQPLAPSGLCVHRVAWVAKLNDQGIGASVRRKEDFRFLSGAGNYTDDINRPGQLYAYRSSTVRSHRLHSVRGIIYSPTRR